MDCSLNGSLDFNLDDVVYWRPTERAYVHAPESQSNDLIRLINIIWNNLSRVGLKSTTPYISLKDCSGEMVGVGGTKQTRKYISCLLADLGFNDVHITSIDLKFSSKVSLEKCYLFEVSFYYIFFIFTGLQLKWRGSRNFEFENLIFKGMNKIRVWVRVSTRVM